MRKVVRGNWYGDCTLEGDYISLIRDSHIEINDNRIELPVGPWGKENILQLVAIRWNGQILIAGQGQVGDKGSGNWLYKDEKWNLLTISFATFPCAFSSDSLYLVVGPNLYRIYDLLTGQLSAPISRTIGSNGIRYINFSQSSDGIVTGDSTYGPGLYNLSQYTKQDGLVIGQSYIDGCVAFLGDIRYKLEDGDTQFIRFHRRGNDIAIAIVKMLELKTVFYWMTVDELKQFPITRDSDKPIEKQPGPVHMSLQAPNLIETVKRMMRVHTDINLLDDDDRAKILELVIKAEGRKELGRKARNKDGSNKNTDGLTWLRTDGKFEIYDVINGSDPNPDNPDRGKFATWDLGLSPTNDTGIWEQGENGYWAPGGDVANGVPVTPAKPPTNPPINRDKDVIRAACNELIRFYNDPDGLNRKARGILSPIVINDQAIFDWFAVYLSGKSLDQVKDEIRQFPEYKQQHEG